MFDAQPVRFGCSCSEDKVRNTMSIYSQKDIAKMTAAHGMVTADCQFCGAHYSWTPRRWALRARMDDRARLRRALARPRGRSSDFDLNPAIRLPEGRKLRPAAVLVAVQPGPRGARAILTKRASHLKHHPGQISLPGGQQDQTDASLEATALREARGRGGAAV